ncbi:hypothetical protein FDP41_012739 [Naegleria fowleri]|uniref:Uncharacterized protein n=1 Tax=Naegleria fowleri TaxID=5763 RepID=A0A6A5C1R3_NAEFO|nr:uncharacterized protein FDP41_012739 [Naegleria fowleri]KAF0980951.1 hypothetical protein FDP41_012739 [Naegleria fowleri]
MKLEELTNKKDTTLLQIMVKKIIPTGHSSNEFRLLCFVLSSLITIPPKLSLHEAVQNRDYLRKKFPEFMKLLTDLCTTERTEQVLARLLCYCVLTFRNVEGEASLWEQKEKLIALCRKSIETMKGSTPLFFFLLPETERTKVVEEVYYEMFSGTVEEVANVDTQTPKQGKSRKKNTKKKKTEKKLNSSSNKPEKEVSVKEKELVKDEMDDKDSSSQKNNELTKPNKEKQTGCCEKIVNSCQEIPKKESKDKKREEKKKLHQVRPIKVISMT